MSDCSTNAFKVPAPKLPICPLCGGEVEIDNPMPGYVSGYGFHCLGCNAYFQVGDSEDDALEAFSKRYEPTCQMNTDLKNSGILGCSNCGMATYTLGSIPSYCQHCGAKVVGDANS